MKVSSSADLVFNKFSADSTNRISAVVIKSFLDPKTDWKIRLTTDFNCQFHLQVFLQSLFLDIATDAIKILDMWLLSEKPLVSKENYNSYITQFFSVLPAVFSDSGQIRKKSNDLIYDFTKKVFERSNGENTQFNQNTWVNALSACLSILSDSKCIMRHREKFAQLFSDYYLSSLIDSKNAGVLIGDFTNSCFSPDSSSIFQSWLSLARKTIKIFFTFPTDKNYQQFIVTTFSLLKERAIKSEPGSEAICKEEDIYRQFMEYAVMSIKEKIENDPTHIYKQSFLLDPIFSILGDFIFIENFPPKFNALKHVRDICWLVANGSFSEKSYWQIAVLKYIEWLVKYNEPRFFNAVLNNCSEIIAYKSSFGSPIMDAIEKTAFHIEINEFLGDWTYSFTNVKFGPTNKYANTVNRFSVSTPTLNECNENILFQKILYFVLFKSTELFNKLFMFFEDKYKEWSDNMEANNISKYILLLGISSSCGLVFDKSPFRKTLFEGLIGIAKTSTEALIAVCITCLELSHNVQRFYTHAEFITCIINILKEKEIEFKGTETGKFFTYVKNFLKYNPSTKELIQKRIIPDMKPFSNFSFSKRSIFSFYETPNESKEENKENEDDENRIESNKMVILARTCTGTMIYNLTELESPERDAPESKMKETILRKDQLELDKEMKPFKPLKEHETKTIHSKALSFLNGMAAIHEVKQLHGLDFAQFDNISEKLKYNFSFVQLNDNEKEPLITNNEGKEEFLSFKEKCFDQFNSSAFIEFNLIPTLDDSSLCTIVYAKKRPNFNFSIPQLNDRHLIYLIPDGNYFQIIARNINFLENHSNDISNPRVLSPQNTARFITIYGFLLVTSPLSHFNLYEGELKPRFAIDFVNQCNERQQIIEKLIGSSPVDIFNETDALFC